ncbi:MAG: PAS domain-containing protein, partial [Kangiellaceae bacterium]|nr:PAS domain-containing protein [Kangiellaceae bacterium]
FVHDISTRQTKRVQHLPVKNDVDDQNNVKTLLLNRQGKILVGTVEGLFEIDQQLLSTPQAETQVLGNGLVEQLNIWSIIEEPNFYWLATDKGLYKLGKQNNRLEFIFKFSDTPFNTGDDDIVVMIKDREDSLWFGTRGDGIFKWKPNPAIKAHYWDSDSAKSRLSDNSVNAVHQSQQSEVWVGTQNGLNLIDPSNKEVKHFLVNPDEKAVTSDSSIYSIAQRDGELWLNTNGGLKVFNRQSKKVVSRIFPETEKEVFNKPFFDIHFFDNEKLALTNDDGMYIYDLTKNTVTLVESTRTNGEIAPALGAIFDIATGDHNSYFVSGVDRLVKFSVATGEVSDFHKLPPSDNFRSQPSDIYRDNDKLWVTYAGYGVYILDANTGEEIRFMSEADLGSNTIMDMFPDNFGNLWFSTNEGLLRVNKLNYSSRIYDSSDGFATSEFNGGSMFRQADGDIFVGSVKGVFEFSPNQLVNRNQRKIYNKITRASLLSKPIDKMYGDHNDQQIVMEHDDFGLKIEFSALLLDKPKQVKYRYWIDGDVVTDPITTSKSELFLPTFEQGVSVLNISAIDYDTGVESEPAKVTIISKPHPLLSNFAYTFYTLTILLVSWFNFYHYQKRAIAKKVAHRKLQQSEERLNLALKGGNSGLWDWHAKDNLIYEPRLANKSNSKEDRVAFEKRIAAIHPDDQEKFLAAWATFMVQDKSVFDVVYRMKNDNDNWAWYRDMATVSEYDENSKPVRITGTFTNITERKEARDKMRLFSTAFENTRDIVFVLNSEKEVIAANRAFYKTTEFEQEGILSSGMNFITDANANRKLIAEIFKHIYLQNHWEGEGLLNRNYKPPLNVLINATSFNDNEGKEHFV